MKILYFAKISEDLGKSEDTLKIEKKLKVYQIIEILKKKNDKYALVFKIDFNLFVQFFKNKIFSFYHKLVVLTFFMIISQ